VSEHATIVTDDDAALAGLVNLLVVLADNKYYLGRHLSSWSVGAPVLESSVACAAIAQQHMGQARVLYPLLDDLPSPVPAGPPEETARDRRYNVTFLDAPFPTWPHAVAALGVVDGALNTLLLALRGTTLETLGRRIGRMLEEERFQRGFAAGRVRELVRFPDGRGLLQEQVEVLFPEMLCWFGPPGESGVAALNREGLLTQDNEQMRQSYLDRVAPVLLDAGIELPARPIDGRWTYDELPWGRWDALQRRLTSAAG
jgi:ring-1,2-phenylacetyl-CoA epoxidase subunit PaaC